MNKRRILLVVVSVAALMFIFSPAHAQRSKKEPEYKNVVAFYPQSILIGSLRVGYERAISNKVSLAAIGGYGTGESSVFYDVNNFSEMHVELQPRFYAFRNTKVLDGAYLSPYFLYKQVSFDSWNAFGQPFKSSASSTQVGYLLGYQEIFPSHLSLGIYAGGGMSFTSGNNNYIEIGYRKGTVLHMGFSVGYGF